MLVVLFVADIILMLVLAMPTVFVYRTWERWVGRFSGCTLTFRKPRQFGLRSWAVRSYEVSASIDDVRRGIDLLPEISREALIARKGEDPNAVGLLSLLPSQTLPTGIDIEWLNSEIVEIRARPYADWPANPEDDADLPLKQHQRLVEHILMYVESLPGGRTKIGYELQVPAWLYVAMGCVVAFVLWLAWVAGSHVIGGSVLHPVARGVSLGWIWANMAIVLAPALWIAYRISGIVLLQSISLLDSVISTFGEMCARDTSGDE